MGFFSKIKKGIGKVFEPITKGLDKITGGKFSKIMGNKWVQGALIAVAVVTGGIAIANGVMAAGEAGVGAAAKAFASNMSMETGKTLMSAMVEGGKQFIGGVAKGLANPLQSDAGKALTGMFDSGSATASITGTPVTGADQLNEAMAGSVGDGGTAVQSALDAGSAPIAKPIAIPGGTENYTFGMPDMAPAPGVSPDSLMAATSGMNPVAPATAGFDPAAWAGPGGDLTAAGSAGTSAGLGQQAAQIAANNAPTMEPGILSKLGNGVVDYAKTPMGMYQAGSMLQGWANGQALQERWDQMDEAQKKIYRSWTDGSLQAPKLSWNPAARAQKPTA